MAIISQKLQNQVLQFTEQGRKWVGHYSPYINKHAHQLWRYAAIEAKWKAAEHFVRDISTTKGAKKNFHRLMITLSENPGLVAVFTFSTALCVQLYFQNGGLKRSQTDLFNKNLNLSKELQSTKNSTKDTQQTFIKDLAKLINVTLEDNDKQVEKITKALQKIIEDKDAALKNLRVWMQGQFREDCSNKSHEELLALMGKKFREGEETRTEIQQEITNCKDKLTSIKTALASIPGLSDITEDNLVTVVLQYRGSHQEHRAALLQILVDSGVEVEDELCSTAIVERLSIGVNDLNTRIAAAEEEIVESRQTLIRFATVANSCLSLNLNERLNFAEESPITPEEFSAALEAHASYHQHLKDKEKELTELHASFSSYHDSIIAVMESLSMESELSTEQRTALTELKDPVDFIQKLAEMVISLNTQFRQVKTELQAAKDEKENGLSRLQTALGNATNKAKGFERCLNQLGEILQSPKPTLATPTKPLGTHNTVSHKDLPPPIVTRAKKIMEELERLRGESEAASGTKTELERQLETMRSEYELERATLEKKVAGLESQLSSAEQEVIDAKEGLEEKLRSQKQLLLQKETAHRESLERLKEELQEAQRLYEQSLEAQKEASSERLRELVAQHAETLAQKATEFEEQASSFDEKIREQEAQIASLTTNVKELESKDLQLVKDEAAYKEALERLQEARIADISLLEGQIKELRQLQEEALQGKIGEIQQLEEALQEKIKEMQQLTEQNSLLSGQLLTAEQKQSKMQQEFQVREENLKREYEVAFSQLHASVCAYEGHIHQKYQGLATQNAAFNPENYQSVLQQAQKIIDDKNKQLEDTNKRLQEVTRQNELLSQEKNEIQAELESLQETHAKEIEDKLVLINRLKEAIKTYETTHRDLTQEKEKNAISVDDLEAQVRELRETNEALVSEQAVVKEQLTNLQREAQNLEEEYAALVKEMETKARLVTDLEDQLKQQVRSSEQELEELKKQWAERENAISIKDEKIGSLTESVGVHEGKIKEFRDLLNKKTQEMQALRDSLQQGEKALCALQRTNASLLLEKQSVDHSILALGSELDRLNLEKQEIDELKQQCMQLQAQLNDTRALYQTATEDSQAKEEKNQQLLRYIKATTSASSRLLLKHLSNYDKVLKEESISLDVFETKISDINASDSLDIVVRRFQELQEGLLNASTSVYDNNFRQVVTTLVDIHKTMNGNSVTEPFTVELAKECKKKFDDGIAKLENELKSHKDAVASFITAFHEAEESDTEVSHLDSTQLKERLDSFVTNHKKLMEDLNAQEILAEGFRKQLISVSQVFCQEESTPITVEMARDLQARLDTLHGELVSLGSSDTSSDCSNGTKDSKKRKRDNSDLPIARDESHLGEARDESDFGEARDNSDLGEGSNNSRHSIGEGITDIREVMNASQTNEDGKASDALPVLPQSAMQTIFHRGAVTLNTAREEITGPQETTDEGKDSPLPFRSVEGREQTPGKIEECEHSVGLTLGRPHREPKPSRILTDSNWETTSTARKPGRKAIKASEKKTLNDLLSPLQTRGQRAGRKNN